MLMAACRPAFLAACAAGCSCFVGATQLLLRLLPAPALHAIEALYDFQASPVSVNDLTEIRSQRPPVGAHATRIVSLRWGGVQEVHTAPMAAHGAPQAAWHRRTLTG